MIDCHIVIIIKLEEKKKLNQIPDIDIITGTKVIKTFSNRYLPKKGYLKSK